MSTLQRLGRVLALREHRSLMAHQRVQACQRAVQEAEQQLEQQESELRLRRHELFCSERSATTLLKPGGSGARFEDFMAHARLAHERIRLQREAVERANQAVVAASQRLDQARLDHSLARKAEEKTRKVQGNAQGLLRLHLTLQEADQLDEAGEMRHRPRRLTPTIEEA